MSTKGKLSSVYSDLANTVLSSWGVKDRELKIGFVWYYEVTVRY